MLTNGYSDHTATYVFVSFTYDHQYSYERMVLFDNRGDFENLNTVNSRYLDFDYLE